MLKLTVVYVPYRKAVHRGRNKTEPLIGAERHDTPWIAMDSAT
jgi:hypothetical protein